MIFFFTADTILRPSPMVAKEGLRVKVALFGGVTTEGMVGSRRY